MTPIFDSGTNLVAWFDGHHFFDLNQEWIAFVANGHVFSAARNTWLGPFHNGSFLDTNGRPVAWLQNTAPSGSLKPLKPLNPLKPLRPLRPLRPLQPLKPLQPLQPLGGVVADDVRSMAGAVGPNNSFKPKPLRGSA